MSDTKDADSQKQIQMVADIDAYISAMIDNQMFSITNRVTYRNKILGVAEAFFTDISKKSS